MNPIFTTNALHTFGEIQRYKENILFLVSLCLRGDYLPSYNENIAELSCYFLHRLLTDVTPLALFIQFRRDHSGYNLLHCFRVRVKRKFILSGIKSLPHKIRQHQFAIAELDGQVWAAFTFLFPHT